MLTVLCAPARDQQHARRWSRWCHLVELTGAGAGELAKAESALSAAEDEVLGALDETQPETRYSLLQQAAVDITVSCTAAIDD